MKPKPYNGHRSWNAWNVALWIGNNEPLYRFAMECIKQARNRPNPLGWAARIFMASYGNARTPDGAIFNRLSVRLALEGLVDE